MKPRKPPVEQDDLLRARLVEMIHMRHELVKLAALIDWDVFEGEWSGFFPSHTGRPATPPRLVAGLCYRGNGVEKVKVFISGIRVPIVPARVGQNDRLAA